MTLGKVSKGLTQFANFRTLNEIHKEEFMYKKNEPSVEYHQEWNICKGPLNIVWKLKLSSGHDPSWFPLIAVKLFHFLSQLRYDLNS